MTQRPRSFRSTLLPWLLGLEAIVVAAWLAIAWLGVAPGDRFQQRQLVKSLAHGHIDIALNPVLVDQTAGPGFGLFAAPPFVVLEPLSNSLQAFDITAYAALIVLAVAAAAASRSVGVPARSGRELLNVAAVVLGVPVLACYSELFHPADVLAAAACLGAVALVARGRVGWAASVLGFAIVTKQWAVVPVLVLAVLARGRDRWVVVLGSVAATAILLLPFLLTNPEATVQALRAPYVLRGRVTAPALLPLDGWALYGLSRFVPLALVGAWCAWLFRRRASFAPELAVAAMAVALGIRPLVDPAGFIYYLAPAYVFAVLIRPRTWVWPVGGLALGALLWFRRSLDDDARLLRIDLRPFGTGDRALSLATTVVIAAVLVAAIRDVVGQVHRSAVASVGQAPTGGPRHAEGGDGVLC